VEPVLRICFSA